MHQAPSIMDRRMEIASLFDEALDGIDGVFIPKRRQGVRHVFHLYILRVERRDDLLQHLINQGIEAKVHYPIPMHLQDAAKSLGYTAGDFPVTEIDAECVITLPATNTSLTAKPTDYRRGSCLYSSKTMKIAVIGSNCFTEVISSTSAESTEARVIGISRSAEPQILFLPYTRHDDANFSFYQIDIVRSFEKLRDLIEHEKPDVVINVAALSDVGEQFSTS